MPLLQVSMRCFELHSSAYLVFDLTQRECSSRPQIACLALISVFWKACQDVTFALGTTIDSFCMTKHDLWGLKVDVMNLYLEGYSGWLSGRSWLQ